MRERGFALFGLLLCLGCPVFDAGAEAPTLKQAIQARQRGALSEASRLLKQMKARLFRLRGAAAVRLQRRASFLAARLALAQARPKAADEWLRRVRPPGLMRDWFLYVHALAWLRGGKPGKAARVFRRLRRQRTWRRRATSHLVEALERSGQWRALSQLTARLQRQRSWRMDWDRFAWLQIRALHKMGRRKRAHQRVARFLRKFPLSRWASKARRQLAKWGKPPLTKKRWRPGSLFRMAVKYPLQARYAARLWWASLSEAQKRQRSNRGYKLAIQGEIQYGLGNWSKALGPFRRLIKSRSFSGSLRFRAAKRLFRIYPVLSQHAEGEKVFLRYARERPGYRPTGLAYYHAAWAAMYQQNYRRASQWFAIYEKRYRKASTVRRYWRSRWFQVWCLYRQGRYREAIAGFRRMRKLTWRYMTFRRQLYWIGRSYEKWNKPKQAMRWYVQIARRSPLSYYGLMALQRLQKLKPKDCKLPGMRGPGASVWKVLCAGRLTEMPPVWKADASRSKRIASILKRNRRLVLSPPMPRRCKKSRRGLCRALHRAAWLARLGLGEDAAAELSRGVRVFWRTPKRMLSVIRWLHAAGGSYTAIRLVRRLERAPYRVRFPSRERLFMHYPPVFSGPMLRYTKQAGLAAEMAWAILREESLYRPKVFSSVGAYGLMQVIAPTGRKIARHLKIKNFHGPLHLFHPATNIRMGSWYLAQLVKRLGGNMFLASAGYNAGPHYAIAWLKNRKNLELDEFAESIWITETRHYVKRIFRSYAVYSYLYRGRVPAPLLGINVKVINHINF